MSRLKTLWFRQQLSPVAVVVLLSLATLACSFMGTRSRPASDRIVILRRLPTLTPTPLPVLTSTATSTPTAKTMDQEAAGDSPTSVILPTSTDEPVAAVTVANVFNNEDTVPVNIVSASADFPASNSADIPTSLPTATTTQMPSPATTSTATATEIPVPANTPTVIPTSTPTPEGWVFSGVRLDQSQGDLLVYGDIINKTGGPQNLALISGTFYDAQGVPISNASTFDYWIIETIRHGGRAPFELTLFGSQGVANFDLHVEAEPGNETDIPREDFEFLDVNPSAEVGDYCVSGKLRNPGSALQFYLATAVVLYDNQDKVINFSDDYQDSPTDMVGDQAIDFNICVDSLGQEVARYELRAWGL